MNAMGWALIGIALTGLGLFGVVNPLATWLMSVVKPARVKLTKTVNLSASLIIIVRNGRNLMQAKLDNALTLNAPPAGLEIIVHSDGSDDSTEDLVVSYADRGIKLSATKEHRGKAFGLNAAAIKCSGDILVFSDADALLAPDALTKLMSWFRDDRVGGVCGRLVVSDQTGAFGAAQSRYVDLNARITIWESRLGALTSNHGALYAVRRGLFPKIPHAVADDLYATLAVVRAGQQFLFDPEALARIVTLSRTPSHELRRRRRIVSTSLNAIALHRALLNPLCYGFYSFRLLVNKVVRRLMPVFLLLLLAGSALAAGTSLLAALLLAGQLAGIFLAVVSPLLPACGGGTLIRIASTACYFYVGNLGMLLGLMDFLRGNLPTRWNPE